MKEEERMETLETLITTDANGRVGSKREHTSEAGGGVGWWEEKEMNREYKWIGEVDQEEENEHGRLITEFAERNKFIVTNTWDERGGGWTWTNNQRFGRVDYILVSENMWREEEEVKRAIEETNMINEGLYWKMQDHIPVGTNVNWTKYAPRPRNENPINT